MSRVDVLAYKMYSYDTDAFVKDIIDYSKNSIILVFDFDKITICYKPSYVTLKSNVVHFYPDRKFSVYNPIKALFVILNMFLLFKLFTQLCFRHRPEVCWVENTEAAVIVGMLKKLHLCSKTIYVPGDWLAQKNGKKILTKIGNIYRNILFPLFDFCACRLNDVVLNHMEKLAEARYEFWGKRIARKEALYKYKPQIKASNNKSGKMAMCFLGNLRKDSGLDVAIKALPEIRKEQDIKLYIIGPKKEYYEYFQKLATDLDVAQYAIFLGFVEMDKLAEILSDCFCGINILTNIDSYSSYTIPGKLIHYLQFLLPIITTKGAGPFVTEIQNYKLGLVIEPGRDEFIDAVFKIYDDVKYYRENIVKYINSIPKIDIREMVNI